MACGILAAMLFYHLHGAAVPAETAVEENVLPELAYLIEPVNLDGFHHEEFLGEHTIHYPWMDWTEQIATTDDYIPLFVNGSIMNCASVYMRDGIPMVPVEMICERLHVTCTIAGEQAAFQYYGRTEADILKGSGIGELVNGVLHMPAGVLAEQLGAEYFYYDDSERCGKNLTYSEDPHMMYNAEDDNFMINNEGN